MHIQRAVPILLALALAAAGCGSKGSADNGADAKKDEEKETQAVPVEVTTLERGPIEQLLRYSTHLEAERAVEVRSEAARKVVALLAEEGNRVAKGQPLVRLEDEQQKTALSRAKGQVDQTRREFDRRAALYDQKMISEQELTQARYELDQAELALADAERELSYTVVRAPIAGTVTARNVKVGDTVAVNQHLFDLVDFDSLVALVYVPEKELPAVAVGQEARLAPPAAPDRLFAGAIDRIAPVVDPKSGTVKVTVKVPYESGLRPGMFLEVELVTAVEPDALLVPKRAIVPDGTQLAVWRLVDGDTVERIWISPRLEDREKVTVGDELTAGDRVVIAGQAGLKQGAKVELVGTPGEPG
ncbi:MAG: efflux RND transporter periplasmic adaptor subunit [Acidobacteria bacterium]|nr:efflux RND transporter periplasmic adaptor subunit [Acidobacteriota bacterium]